MGDTRIAVEGDVGAPAGDVYRILADYRTHHPYILPPAFGDFVVEEGGVGAGTVIRFTLRLAGRTQTHRQRMEEQVPGQVLREIELDGPPAVTTFTVTPAGDRSHLRIETAWQSGGIRGLVERIVAPRVLRPLYLDELARLDRYARENRTS